MRKLLGSVAALALLGAAAPVFAADAPVAKLPVKAVAVHHDWTGWYAGVNYGTGLSQTQGTATGFVGSFDRAGTGYSVGVQGGYNWQFNPNWVAGLELDINWLGIDRRLEAWNNPGNFFGVKTEWYGTIRGRLGYTSSPSLFYVTGGAAFVDVKNRFDRGGLPQASSSETTGGWTAGWGTETMLGGNWSAKAEYLYINAGHQDVINTGSTARFDNRFHVFRQGLNYRFGGPGAAASALPAYNWNGFYAGLHGGVGALQVNAATNVHVGEIDIAQARFTGGVQAGVNWQFAPAWVAGVEGDIGRLGIDRTRQSFNGAVAFGAETDWYGTVRGRLGRSTGPALLYVTAGAAFVHVKNLYNISGGGTQASNSETAVGWTYGGGIEAALGNNWTAKTEYLLIDAGHQDVFNPAIGAAGSTARFDNRFHVFRFGVNRKFGS